MAHPTQPTIFVQRTGKVGRPRHLFCPLHGKLTHRSGDERREGLFCTGRNGSGCGRLIAEPAEYWARTLNSQTKKWEDRAPTFQPSPELPDALRELLRRAAEQAEPEQAEPEQAEPEQAEPEQAEPEHRHEDDAPSRNHARRPSTDQRTAEQLLSWIQDTLRPFCEARVADGQPFDQIGLRPAENAAKLLLQGIPADAIKHALTLHYPPEARRSLDVRTFDPTTFAARPFGPVDAPASAQTLSGKHRALGYVRAAALAGIPVALVGPPGTGKTTLARQLADDIGCQFGMVSMTRGTSPSAFNGRPKIGGDGGVIQSQFERIYREGGVFLFDEMDAAEPNLLLLVNAALANGHFANAATGEMVPKAANFIPVAGMNTLGLGGDRRLVGREKQDAAALDRWHAGRVEIQLDTELETALYWQTLTNSVA